MGSVSRTPKRLRAATERLPYQRPTQRAKPEKDRHVRERPPAPDCADRRGSGVGERRTVRARLWRGVRSAAGQQSACCGEPPDLRGPGRNSHPRWLTTPKNKCLPPRHCVSQERSRRPAASPQQAGRRKFAGRSALRSRQRPCWQAHSAPLGIDISHDAKAIGCVDASSDKSPTPPSPAPDRHLRARVPAQIVRRVYEIATISVRMTRPEADR